MIESSVNATRKMRRVDDGSRNEGFKWIDASPDMFIRTHGFVVWVTVSILMQ